MKNHKFKIGILFLILMCKINLNAQSDCNRIVFKGSFNTSDTVYIIDKNKNIKYTIGFDSMRLSFQGIVGQVNFLCVPNANRLIVVYNNNTTRVTNRYRSKEIVIKKSGTKLIITKQKRRGYL